MNNSVLSFWFRGIRRINYFIAHKIMPWYNRLKMMAYCVDFGENVNITSTINLHVAKTGVLKIGDNVTISGTPDSNPLNQHIPIIRVYEEASLIIGQGCGLSSPIIWCSKSVVLGDGVGLGGNVVIMDTDAHSLDYRERMIPIIDKVNSKRDGIEIGEYALIGTGTVILKGVHIGAHSIIGAGSIVTNDIPADSVAAGNPCKVIKRMDY